METLIEDLLGLARDGDLVGELEAVELGAVVRDCWHHVTWDDASLVVDVDRRIRADTTRLRQLLENLMQNAVEHADGDVTVTVGVLDDGFYVADDGPGIPSADLEAVFDAGYSTKVDGTGLGLRIVERTAEAHDWDISVETDTEAGTRFEFSSVENPTLIADAGLGPSRPVRRRSHGRTPRDERIHLVCSPQP